MEHRAAPDLEGGVARQWYHPRHSNVLNTLLHVRKMAAREGGGGGEGWGGGLVLLPQHAAIAHRQELRGARRVASWPAGSPVLEEWRGGLAGWRSLAGTLTPLELYLFEPDSVSPAECSAQPPGIVPPVALPAPATEPAAAQQRFTLATSRALDARHGPFAGGLGRELLHPVAARRRGRSGAFGSTRSTAPSLPR
jgi:hypothetical protein